MAGDALLQQTTAGLNSFVIAKNIPNSFVISVCFPFCPHVESRKPLTHWEME